MRWSIIETLINLVFNLRALQNVQDIFGGDFDFEEIAKYGKDYVDDDDEIDEDSYYDEQVQRKLCENYGCWNWFCDVVVWLVCL